MTLSKEQFERLIARSTDMVVATDRKGTVVYYNDGAARGLGYSPEEVLGTFVGRLYPSVDEAKRVKAALASPEPGGGTIVETTFVAKDGREIPVAISGSLIYDDEGRENGTIGFAKDLAEILHKDQLATLGEVAIGLSHEINNPLAVILNQAALLETEISRLAGDEDSSVEFERVDAIRREVARITEILTRLEEMVRTDRYETIDYIGPARMIDLRNRREIPEELRQRLSGLRILVVDDDQGVCRSMEEILMAMGCEVQTAGDGKEALGRLEQSTFDLVLSDVVMPEMDGYELYMSARKRYPNLPVLMMTAFHYDKDHIIKRSRLEGLEGVIFKKPVDPTRLCTVIAETVGR